LTLSPTVRVSKKAQIVSHCPVSITALVLPSCVLQIPLVPNCFRRCVSVVFWVSFCQSMVKILARTEPLGADKGQTTPVNSTASTKDDTDDPDVDEDDVPEGEGDEAAGNESDNSANTSSPGPNAFSSSTTRSPTEVQHDRELGIVESSRPHKLANSTQSSQAPPSVLPQAPSTDPAKNSATKEKSQPPQGKRKSSGKCRPKRLRRV
jgi:hypothetical protein